jgi:hypothetical protein
MVAGAVFTATSYVNGLLDDSYPFGVVAIRIVTGSAEDPIGRRNLLAAERLVKQNRLLAVIGSLAYRPGEQASVCSMFRRAVLGALGHMPKWLAAMIDIESGPEPIDGDRSAELDELYLRLTSVVGCDARRVIGFASPSSFTRHWPSRPAGMAGVLASYSARSPQFSNLLVWQYTNGFSSVVGLPSATAPFGACDHLVAPHLTAAQLAGQLGVRDPTTSDPLEDVVAMYGSRAAFEAMLDKKLGIDPANADGSGRASVNGLLAFWLTRTMITLRHGTKNRAFQAPPELVDGVGLQGALGAADPQGVAKAVAAAIAPLSAQVERLQRTIDDALGAVRS